MIPYKAENEMKGNESDINTPKNNEGLLKKVAPGRPQRRPELNTAGEKVKPEQHHQQPAPSSPPGAKVPDLKKINRPPRPGLPHANKKDDSKIDKSNYPEEKSPIMPKEQDTTTDLKETQIAGKPDQVPDAGVQPAKLNRPIKPPWVTDAREHDKNKSPNLNSVEKTHESKLSGEKPSRPPSLRERPTTARSTQDKKADVSKSSDDREACKNLKPCKLVRPPPPNKHGEDSVENKKGKEHKPRVFRVHSLTKTEVESFNKETFSIKPRKDEKNVGRARGKERKKPGKPPPPVFPKPPRLKLPLQHLKSPDEKHDQEKKVACEEIEESGGKKESRAEDEIVKKGIHGDIEGEGNGIACENLHEVIVKSEVTEVQEKPIADVVKKLEKKSDDGTKTSPETSKVERVKIASALSKVDNAVEEKQNDEEKKEESTNERCLEEKSTKNEKPQQQKAVSLTESGKYLASEEGTENEEKKDDDTVERSFDINKSLSEDDNACEKMTDSPKDEESEVLGKQGAEEEKLASCEKHHEVRERDVDDTKDLPERKDDVVEEENDIKATEELTNTEEKMNVLKISSKLQGEEEMKGECPSEEIAPKVEMNTNNQKSSNELSKTNMVECVKLKFEMNLDEPNEIMTETAVGNEAVDSEHDDKEGLQSKEVALKDVVGSVETETKVSTSEDDKTIREDTDPREINGIGGDSVEETCSNSEGIVRSEEVSESEVLCNSGVSTTLQETLGASNGQLPEAAKSAVLVAQEVNVEASVSKSEKSLEPTVEVCVQSTKKKTPPPKPRRISSLKRDSRPLIDRSAETQEQIQEIAEEKLTEESMPQIQVTSEDEDQIHVVSSDVVSSGSTPKIPKDPPMSPTTRNVTFQDDVESKETSFLNRSKSFSSAAKRRSVDGAKETANATKSEPRGVGVTRSLSFGGVMKRIKNPPRPSPPKFFVEPSQTSDSTVTEEENENSGSNEKSGKNFGNFSSHSEAVRILLAFQSV